jgi:hypothetical protein
MTESSPAVAIGAGNSWRAGTAGRVPSGADRAQGSSLGRFGERQAQRGSPNIYEQIA